MHNNRFHGGFMLIGGVLVAIIGVLVFVFIRVTRNQDDS